MGEKRLRKFISQSFANFRKKIMAEFQATQFICLTIDLWSSLRRGFMGVTAQWLCESTLRRKSAALACTRLKGKKFIKLHISVVDFSFLGRHSYDVIAKEINAVLLDYDIKRKAQTIITDNGSNFVKAFKHYQTTRGLDNICDADSDDETGNEIEFDYGGAYGIVPTLSPH